MSPHAKFLHRKPLAEARALLLSGVAPVEAEEIDTGDACGRVAAETITAFHPSPHYRASAMDGIAVRAADTFAASAQLPVRLRIVASGQDGGAAAQQSAATAGAQTAGSRSTESAGEQSAAASAAGAAGELICHAVDTGSPLADWTDAVLRIEDVAISGDICVVKSPVPPGRDVRRAGEDIDAGAVIAPAGARLTPYDVGAVLATGTSRVQVRRRPRVAIIATGSEVVEPGDTARPGQVIEYNSRVMAGLIAQWGARAQRLGIVADDEASLQRVIGDACRGFDVVCVIAGSSAGRKDLTIPALEQLGEVFVHGVDIAPGRPVALARAGATPVVAVPGYPVSAIVACEQLLRPLLAALLGTAELAPRTLQALVRRKIPSRLGIEEFRRVCLARGRDGYVVAPLPGGAGSISTVAGAHGWLRIPSNREGIDAGGSVTIELMVPPAEVDAALVVAGHPCQVGTEIERRLRALDPRARVHYLHLGEFDAAGALARGEAHLALSAGDAAHGARGDAAGDETRLVELRVGGGDDRAWAAASSLAQSPVLRLLVDAGIVALN
ncbi:MAG: hypothetical protein HY899_15055 [Deltaproteobacteria bacterium]|nr:hypothetical protein [Deltaproteobacteria bacterium]